VISQKRELRAQCTPRWLDIAGQVRFGLDNDSYFSRNDKLLWKDSLWAIVLRIATAEFNDLHANKEECRRSRLTQSHFQRSSTYRSSPTFLTALSLFGLRTSKE